MPFNLWHPRESTRLLDGFVIPAIESERARRDEAGEKLIILSNVDIECADLVNPHLLREELNTFPEWITGSTPKIVLLAETASYDGTSLRDSSQLTNSLLKMLRLIRCSIIMTTQHPDTVAAGMIQQADYVVQATPRKAITCGCRGCPHFTEAEEWWEDAHTLSAMKPPPHYVHRDPQADDPTFFFQGETPMITLAVKTVDLPGAKGEI